MPKYPSKEEILAHSDLLTKQDITILKTWKKTKQHCNLNCLLLFHLAKSFGKEIDVYVSNKYAYHPRLNSISLDASHPSIISTLHEIGHAKFGPNELLACAWSVQMFRAVFPKAYAKLKWRGHMLVKGN